MIACYPTISARNARRLPLILSHTLAIRAKPEQLCPEAVEVHFNRASTSSARRCAARTPARRARDETEHPFVVLEQKVWSWR